MRRDAWAGTLLWWSCQSPGAHSYGLLNHPNSFHRGMFKLNAKFHLDSLLYLLVLLNVMATQDTCSLNGIYRPHWLVQWSRHRSHTHSPVHSPWLPGYINATQTVLVILTMAGLFLDRPHIYTLATHVTWGRSKLKGHAWERRMLGSKGLWPWGGLTETGGHQRQEQRACAFRFCLNCWSWTKLPHTPHGYVGDAQGEMGNSLRQLRIQAQYHFSGESVDLRDSKGFLGRMNQP